ncbi:hypothetical protein PIB30_038013 [Stylosanthes scabra]|uniref:Uncharacterized protein n=1 Tax=Stylosanthes scabra TaxID=79078 RepID=A0ABU6SEW9_9FABA|nr:hypothetical protein [Stylosanthes scabra]
MCLPSTLLHPSSSLLSHTLTPPSTATATAHLFPSYPFHPPPLTLLSLQVTHREDERPELVVRKPQPELVKPNMGLEAGSDEEDPQGSCRNVRGSDSDGRATTARCEGEGRAATTASILEIWKRTRKHDVLDILCV